MKENNKWIKTAIIIVAVVVILESVVIISNNGKIAEQNKVAIDNQPTQILNEKEPGVVGLQVKSNDSEMKLKGSYQVWVEMSGLKTVNLDAIDLYVKYDKTAFSVSKLDFSGMTLKPTFSKISDTKDVVVVNYFITESAGLAVNNGQVMKLVGFNVTPKKAGTFEFEISRGDESGNSETMLVENRTSKELPFESQKLSVIVK